MAQRLPTTFYPSMVCASEYAPDTLDGFIAHIHPLTPLLDAMPNTVFFIKNTQARYVFINHTLQVRLGLKQKTHIIGQTCEQIFNGKQGKTYTLQDFKVLEGKAIVDKLELHTYLSGQLGWCITHKIPIYNQTGDIIAMAGVSIDIDKHSSHRLHHHERLGRVVEYLEEHLEQKLNIHQLAKHANISISQLERLFRAVLGLSPRQMIQKMRLELAVNLLQHSNQSVVEIAIQCGYSDHSAFSRQFKQLTGLSPSEFRRDCHAKYQPS